MQQKIQAGGTQMAIGRNAPSMRRLFAGLRARVLAPMLRGSALVAFSALLLSPPIIAAYSIWPALLALFWLGWVTLSWWLCERGQAEAAATVFVALTWITFTLPDAFSAARFSEGNILASLVLAALLLPWQGVAAVGMGSLAAAGAAVALDSSTHALPVLFPASNYLRLAATLLEMSLVFIALCLAAKELRLSVRSAIREALACRDETGARRERDGQYRAPYAHAAGAAAAPDDGCFIECNAAAVEADKRSGGSTPGPLGAGRSDAKGA